MSRYDSHTWGYCGCGNWTDEEYCSECWNGECTNCGGEGWLPVPWLRNPKDAEKYEKLRIECPECGG